MYLIEKHYDEFTDLFDALPNKDEQYAELDNLDEDFANCLVGPDREEGLAGSAFNAQSIENKDKIEEWLYKNFRDYFYKHRVECS